MFDLAVIDDILSVSEDEWLSGEDSDDADDLCVQTS